MFKIYFIEEKRYSNQFSNAFDALKLAKLKGLECQIKIEEKAITTLIASWSPVEGTVWYISKYIGKELTTSEAAFLLGLSYIRVIQFCQEGRLGKKFGKAWMITIDELEEFAKLERPTGVKRQEKDNVQK